MKCMRTVAAVILCISLIVCGVGCGGKDPAALTDFEALAANIESADLDITSHPHYITADNENPKTFTTASAVSLAHTAVKTTVVYPHNPLSSFYAAMANTPYRPVDKTNDTVDLSFQTDALLDGDYTFAAVNTSATPEPYAFNTAECERLLVNIFRLSHVNGAPIDIVKNATQAIDDGDTVISYAEKDRCFYSYFVSQSDSVSTIWNIYFKSSNGVYITDVSFDLLYVLYYEGGETGTFLKSSHRSNQETVQVAALIAATENAMTGKTSLTALKNGVEALESDSFGRATAAFLPPTYTVGNHTATVACTHYSRDDNEGLVAADGYTVYTFRITATSM